MRRIFQKPWAWVLCGLIIVIAVLLRTYRISANEFVFYDEGMYLGQNRSLLELIQANPPHSFSEFIAIMNVLLKSALATAKAFWFFLLNLRVFSVGADAWYVARLVSWISGFLTIGLTFLFARRLFQNNRIAILSACVLAILPSHVFYSRLGMQESLSTLLFLAGIYVYVFAKGFSWRPIVVGVLLTLTFLCNYRMIISPLFLIAIEGYRLLFLKERIDLKKALTTLVVFVFLVWWIGSLYDGANRFITFGWMGHQAHDATGKFDPLKFIAFPLNTFVLEGFLVALFFWYALWQAKRKQFNKILPFLLVLTQMAIFSVAADQGARYLCVVLPFFAISVAQAMDDVITHHRSKTVVAVVVSVAFITMILQSYVLTINQTQYEQAVRRVKAIDPNAKIISTQPLVTQLFVQHPEDIKDCPKNISDLGMLIKEGYYYLILDPQAYVSWAENDIKFNTKLLNFLEDIRTTTPIVQLHQFSQPVLARFVLDHNEHVIDSYRFIFNHPHGANIEIYDLRQSLSQLMNK